MDLIPDEVLIEIFLYLSTRNLVKKIVHVSKRFHSIVNNSDYIWKKKYNEIGETQEKVGKQYYVTQYLIMKEKYQKLDFSILRLVNSKHFTSREDQEENIMDELIYFLSFFGTMKYKLCVRHFPHLFIFRFLVYFSKTLNIIFYYEPIKLLDELLLEENYDIILRFYEDYNLIYSKTPFVVFSSIFFEYFTDCYTGTESGLIVTRMQRLDFLKGYCKCSNDYVPFYRYILSVIDRCRSRGIKRETGSFLIVNAYLMKSENDKSSRIDLLDGFFYYLFVKKKRGIHFLTERSGRGMLLKFLKDGNLKSFTPFNIFNLFYFEFSKSDYYFISTEFWILLEYFTKHNEVYYVWKMLKIAFFNKIIPFQVILLRNILNIIELVLKMKVPIFYQNEFEIVCKELFKLLNDKLYFINNRIAREIFSSSNYYRLMERFLMIGKKEFRKFNNPKLLYIDKRFFVFQLKLSLSPKLFWSSDRPRYDVVLILSLLDLINFRRVLKNNNSFESIVKNFVDVVLREKRVPIVQLLKVNFLKYLVENGQIDEFCNVLFETISEINYHSLFRDIFKSISIFPKEWRLKFCQKFISFKKKCIFDLINFYFVSNDKELITYLVDNFISKKDDYEILIHHCSKKKEFHLFRNQLIVKLLKVTPKNEIKKLSTVKRRKQMINISNYCNKLFSSHQVLRKKKHRFEKPIIKIFNVELSKFSQKFFKKARNLSRYEVKEILCGSNSFKIWCSKFQEDKIIFSELLEELVNVHQYVCLKFRERICSSVENFLVEKLLEIKKKVLSVIFYFKPNHDVYERFYDYLNYKLEEVFKIFEEDKFWKEIKQKEEKEQKDIIEIANYQHKHETEEEKQEREFNFRYLMRWGKYPPKYKVNKKLYK